MIIGIIAMDKNNLIGVSNNGYKGMPWHNKEDLSLFKSLTINNTILMGRNTYNAIGRELPNRKNIVLTSSPEKYKNNDNLLFCKNPNKILEKFKNNNTDILYIIGGKSIYEQFIDDIDKFIISRIDGDYTGDIFFDLYKNKFSMYREVHLKTLTLEMYLNNNIEKEND